ncbi:MAG: hypothetical protein ACE5GJ_07265 [Gemmatimonadota bacterium]
MSKILRKSLASLGAAVALVAALSSGLSAQETKVGGLFFGDYYYITQHHDGDLKDANGFQARRLYLTVNTKFNTNFDARVRLEAASPGDFETAGTMTPFVKDLWVRWKQGRHSILVGLSSSPTWDVPEKEWGYRDLEKTPLDLAKLGSSRDFGIAFKGAFDEARKVEYHFMFGNGSSTKGETNKGKKVMGALIFHPTQALTLHAYVDREDRAGDKDRTTYELFAGFQGDWGRLGGMWAQQTRKSPGAADVDVGLVSGYGVIKANEKVNLVARVDRLLDPNPDAAKISWFRMSPTSKATFFLAGLDVKMAEKVHIIPNVEFVTYDDSALDSDIFLRTTFSVKF